MKKTVLKFGVISGVIISVFMLSTVPFIDRIGMDYGVIVGYTGIVLAFLLVFPGIRSYRDNVNNGTISFGKAFSVGLLITLVTCFFYILTWEIVYANFLPDFFEKAINHTMEKMRTSGVGQAEITAELERLKSLGEMYRNNLLFRVALTFIEPFPVGLLVSIISALILKRKPPVTENAPDAVASTA